MLDSHLPQATPFLTSLQWPATRVGQLCEHGADDYPLRRYVTRWTLRLQGGLNGQVCLKGDLRNYMVFVLRQLQIGGVFLPQR